MSQNNDNTYFRYTNESSSIAAVLCPGYKVIYNKWQEKKRKNPINDKIQIKTRKN